jgi:hypothetical protein
LWRTARPARPTTSRAGDPEAADVSVRPGATGATRDRRQPSTETRSEIARRRQVATEKPHANDGRPQGLCTNSLFDELLF